MLVIVTSNSHVAFGDAFGRAANLIRSERQDLAVAIVYSVATGLLTLVLPVTIQALVTTVAFGSVLQPIAVLTALVAAALLASALLVVLRFKVLENMQRRIFVRMTSEVTDSLLRYRADLLDPQRAPELVNRFLDVATVQKSASVLVVDGLTVAMQTIVGVCLLGAYHPYLLAFDVVLVASILFVLFVLGHKAVRTSLDESRSKYEVAAWLEEIARHNTLFREPAGTRFALRRANDLVLNYLDNRGRHFRVLLRQVIGTQALQAIALSSLLGVGGYLVVAGELTLGQLVAAELVVSLAVGSFAKFGKSLETYYDLQAALDKLEHLTHIPLERTDGETSARLPGPVSLNLVDVSFAYESSADVLSGINLTVPAGARIAIHGAGAAGKSTIFDLVYGTRDLQVGRIEINGVPNNRMSLAELRRDVMLLRGNEVFPGTVFDNVALGTERTPDEVWSAVRKAGLWQVVNSLPEGLNTDLAASGRPLSPSQALRLVFARAFLHSPRLLLVDEALDHISDLRTDGDLAHSLFGPSAPWSLIVATEREDLWPLCDVVYGLQDGRLTEQTQTGDLRVAQ